MKGCKLCEILDHQQKQSGRLGNSSSEDCNHGTNYGSLDHFRDMVLAAHLLRGEFFTTSVTLLTIFHPKKKSTVV